MLSASAPTPDATACQDVAELGPDHLGGHTAAHVDAHLQSCDGCAEHVRQVIRSAEASAHLDEPVSDHLRARLLEVFRRVHAGREPGDEHA